MDYIELLLKAAFVLGVLWVLNPLYRTLRSEYLVCKQARLTMQIIELKNQVTSAEEKKNDAIMHMREQLVAFDNDTRQTRGNDFFALRDLNPEELVEHQAHRSRVASGADPLVHFYTERITELNEQIERCTNERVVVASNLGYFGYICSACKIRTD